MFIAYEPREIHEKKEGKKKKKGKTKNHLSTLEIIWKL